MNTTGRTKMIGGKQYSEVLEEGRFGQVEKQWTATSNLTMTLTEAERIIAQADVEQLEVELKEELASEYAQDEENQECIANLRTRIAELNAKLA